MMNVCVTGMGAVTPAGPSVEHLWSAVVERQSTFRPVTRFETEGFYTNLAGEVDRGGGVIDFARAATRHAIQDAGLKIDDPHQIGMAIGTTLGTTDQEERPSGSLYHCIASTLADEQNLLGPCITFDVACASSVHAIGYGFEMIRRGRMDAMIVGGADQLSPFVFSGFHSLQALAHGVMRPFDAHRDGMILGEGAGILVLESEARARKRGARVHARVRGWGFMEDAFHVTAPDPTGSGMARTIRQALDDARISTDEIGYVSAHGTATRFNDRMETLALKSALGQQASSIPVSSMKAVLGHCLGASGAIETIATIRAQEESRIPPTLNYETPDPECDLDYVPNESREHSFDSFLKIAAGFGGQNGALVLSHG